MKLVLSTCPAKEVDHLVSRLLEEKLVACVNVIGGASSRYWWNGEIQSDTESILIMKTRASLTGRVIARIGELHSYEVPEAIVIDVEQGNPAYLKWVEEVTT